MGIDAHGLNFLCYASQKKALGRVATIGRQALVVPRAYLEFGTFCEQFLAQRFNAQVVDSYDYSNFEGATHVVDLNKPIVPEKQYDTVIDCGCTEHIFNVSQALQNISRLGANGAQIIHVLPANNFCGHGFWQFSPELFFSLYSEANGYAQTEVFLADLKNNRTWFQVEQPKNGARATVISSSPMYVLCRTCKVGDISHENVQQSDYVHSWGQTSQAKRRRNKILELTKGIIKRNPFVYRSSLLVYGKVQERVRGFGDSVKLSDKNRHLKKRSISKLLAS